MNWGVEQAKWVLATGVLASEGEGEMGWARVGSCLRRNDGGRG